MTQSLSPFLNHPTWAIYRPALQSLIKQALVPQAVESKDGQRLSGARTAYVRGHVAVIPVMGPIVPHESLFTWYFDIATVEGIAKDVQLAVENPNIYRILFHFDSPGGHTTGIAELAHIIRACLKPTYSYSTGLLCSAAYWLAAATNEIYVHETALVGSVGVLLVTQSDDPDDIIITSRHAPNKHVDPATEAGQHHLQTLADSIEAVFIRDLAQFRGVSERYVQDQFGQGDVLVGDQAKTRQMVDGLTSFESLLSQMQGTQNMTTSSAATSLAEHTDAAHLQAQITTLQSEKTALTGQLEASVSELKALKAQLDTHQQASEQRAEISALFDVLEGDQQGLFAQLHVQCLTENVTKAEATQRIKTLRAEMGQVKVVQAAWSPPPPGQQSAPPEGQNKDFNALVAEYMAQGMSKPDAVRLIAKEHPEAQQAFIDAAKAAS